jgi:hypothetical protein
MAFSVNSVGHLVKSGQLSLALKHFDEVVGGPAESYAKDIVPSLGKALDLAMRTIDLASVTVSGKCPVSLPKLLQGKNYATYKGWYHTDVTIPSEYFRPNIDRPADVTAKELDFTYLYHDDIDNPDHLTTGRGRRVWSDADVQVNPRLSRMVAESAVVKDQPILQRALRRNMRR